MITGWHTPATAKNLTVSPPLPERGALLRWRNRMTHFLQSPGISIGKDKSTGSKLEMNHFYQYSVVGR